MTCDDRFVSSGEKYSMLYDWKYSTSTGTSIMKPTQTQKLSSGVYYRGGEKYIKA